MKKSLSTIILLFSTILLFAQTVKNVRSVQDGEKIIISYEIDNSTSEDLFKVVISCDLGDGKKNQLKSVTGDVGNNIKGGKGEYKIVWNVLNEVKTLESAEFFINIEKKKLGSSTTFSMPMAKAELHPWFVSAQLYQSYGLKAGYFKNWGAFVNFTFYNDNSYTDEDNYSYTKHKFFILGVSKRVYYNDRSRFYTTIGIGNNFYTDDVKYDYYDFFDNSQHTGDYIVKENHFLANVGFTYKIKRLLINLDLIYNFSSSYNYNIEKKYYPTLGVGYSF
jgi:hypothetical protein